MMKQIEEIKNALESVDVSTARGRRTLNGKQINTEPERMNVINRARNREGTYLSLSKNLRYEVESNLDGITDEELEKVEFVMEQLETLARIAYEQVIENN